jgi:hypothetical protein
MVLSLEVVQAREGDCLILHYGEEANPKLIVIDGGPKGVFRNHLKPRLLSIKEALSPDDALPLSMVMVSHIDADHIKGILDLTADIRNDVGNNRPAQFDIQNLWHNSFDDIVGNLQIPIISSIAASASPADLSAVVPELVRADSHVAAVIASTGQGRQLRNDAQFLTIPVNSPFGEMAAGKATLVRGNDAESFVDWEDGLQIKVVHPNRTRLLELQAQWDEDLRKAATLGDNSIIFAAMESLDKSPYNLSSIVCIAELGGKRILLTGDARSDDILNGLRLANLLDGDGKIHVDVLKVPHHGSDRNSSQEFYEHVTADHYVISGDGSHKNPDKATLVMLAEATEGRGDFTIHFTNHDGSFNLREKLDGFIEDERRRGRNFGVNFIEDGTSSIVLNLLQPIGY